MANLRGSELIIIVLLVLLLFGAKRMPDAARSVGRSLRIFKSEMKGMAEDDKVAVPATSEVPVAPLPAQPTPQATPLPMQPSTQPSPPPPAGA